MRARLDQLRAERGERRVIAACAVKAFKKRQKGLRLCFPVICKIIADQLLDITMHDGQIEPTSTARRASAAAT